mmetsp:Transcript_22405/g.27012  ORF Transcript_22405/g.27012 Transcript_22405/m.27012 type:complete len:200 (+) Transcript_22405:310-909(+)|eukprot:CAMPEP_0197851392 /NCGR_PEP_ID=MMETSP1438-20131217/17971_1 /TAXON_ID=1461541 /ORGANISM="Pterosperma sp., Strain CCMP1384" /LENGTH=199 /DNA_ID=CAMNT_0043464977 /DNA_START=308 /DNA_END=907 /DNA_ORIENTATION=+
MADTEDLPRAHVKRIVKGKLTDIQKTLDGEDKKREAQIQKEALHALSESAKIFIHYLTATANDLCHENHRQTISAEDVLKAVEETEFGEFLEPMKAALEGFRKEAQLKSKNKASLSGKKRKAGDTPLDGEEAGEPGEEGYAEDPAADGAGLQEEGEDIVPTNLDNTFEAEGAEGSAEEDISGEQAADDETGADVNGDMM